MVLTLPSKDYRCFPFIAQFTSSSLILASRWLGTGKCSDDAFFKPRTICIILISLISRQFISEPGARPFQGVIGKVMSMIFMHFGERLDHTKTFMKLIFFNSPCHTMVSTTTTREDVYNVRTWFASQPTTQSSIIGIDFFRLGLKGEEYGPFGQLFPLSDPLGSGFVRCIENEVEDYSSDVNYLSHSGAFDKDGVGTLSIDYEIKRVHDYRAELRAKDCVSPISDIRVDLSATRTPEWTSYDLLTLDYVTDLTDRANIWDESKSKIQVCSVIKLIRQDDDNSTVLTEELSVITQPV